MQALWAWFDISSSIGVITQMQIQVDVMRILIHLIWLWKIFTLCIHLVLQLILHYTTVQYNKILYTIFFGHFVLE